jgi:hypothetical protein
MVDIFETITVFVEFVDESKYKFVIVTKTISHFEVSLYLVIVMLKKVL